MIILIDNFDPEEFKSFQPGKLHIIRSKTSSGDTIHILPDISVTFDTFGPFLTESNTVPGYVLIFLRRESDPTTPGNWIADADLLEASEKIASTYRGLIPAFVGWLPWPDRWPRTADFWRQRPAKVALAQAPGVHLGSLRHKNHPPGKKPGGHES